MGVSYLKGAVDRVPRYFRLRSPQQLEQQCCFQLKSHAQLYNNGGFRTSG